MFTSSYLKRFQPNVEGNEMRTNDADLAHLLAKEWCKIGKCHMTNYDKKWHQIMIRDGMKHNEELHN